MAQVFNHNWEDEQREELISETKAEIDRLRERRASVERNYKSELRQQAMTRFYTKQIRKYRSWLLQEGIVY